MLRESSVAVTLALLLTQSQVMGSDFYKINDLGTFPDTFGLAKSMNFQGQAVGVFLGVGPGGPAIWTAEGIQVIPNLNCCWANEAVDYGWGSN